MAQGAAYTLLPQPNYIHCTDPEDATQLTDGQVTEGYFWTQQGTVGWRGAKYVTITVDLGRIEPIAGASFRTAAGVANVAWPVAIRIHVSEDGKIFYDAGDLLELDPNARDLPGEYAVRTFTTQAMQCKGRYVRFMVTPAGPYVFTDEVEVFRGDDSFLELEPTGQPVADLDEIYLGYKITAGVRRRFNADLVGLERSIRDSDLDPSVKQPLLKRVAELRPKLESTIPSRPSTDFKTILPFNKVHSELFRIQAKLWSASGHPAVSAWAAGCHWDPLDLFAAPQGGSDTKIEVHTTLGEYRSAAFNLANATDSPVQVSFRVEGISGGSTPSWLTSYAVPWTDTVTGQAVAAALVEISPDDGQWTVEVQPGLTQQVWLTFHVTDLPPGRHQGDMVITAPGMDDARLPLSVKVYPLTFPTATTLWLGGWSYTDGQGRYGITPANRAKLIKHLQDRFVNAPWATAGVMMKFSFRDGQPELDTRAFDDWIAQWPQARACLVFLSVGRKFAGTELGTPEFNQRVGRWISAWVQHLAGKGINADQLGLLLVDEPRTPEHDETIVAWAEAIHAAEPDVLIWEDPVYREPKEGNPRMYELSDILCPNRPMWLSVGKAFEDFYRKQQQGRTLQLYSCSGPARLLDPYSYYRLQAWHCWQIGATGSFFWAFGDNSRASSWNEYAATTGPYTPLFLDDESVVPAKQMEAIRESVEDYEYFVMLDRAVRRASGSNTGPALARARDLLQHAADRVLGSQDPAGLRWHVPKDRTQADAVRVQLLEALTELTRAAD